jgi:hypothetical protein
MERQKLADVPHAGPKGDGTSCRGKLSDSSQGQFESCKLHFLKGFVNQAGIGLPDEMQRQM